MGEVVGKLTAEAAEHLGLSTETQCVQGGADAFVGLVGLGGRVGGSVGRPAALWGRRGPPWGAFGAVLGPFWRLLGPS